MKSAQNHGDLQKLAIIDGIILSLTTNHKDEMAALELMKQKLTIAQNLIEIPHILSTIGAMNVIAIKNNDFAMIDDNDTQTKLNYLKYPKSFRYILLLTYRVSVLL
jgi:hypothetical protein